MVEEVSLTMLDYIVTLVMLLIPLGIGIFFAIKDAKKATRDEYLLGGKEMSTFPVTLSIFVTFQSAISVMGVPSDIYSFGVMFIFIYIGFSLSYVIGYFTLIPLMAPLRLTSVYEYLELRFKSKTLRMLSTVIGMVQTVCYMAIVQLTPALALQATSGIPLWVSIAIIGIIGTIYTAIGGIKSVIWTDAFQCLIMFVGVISIIVKGSMLLGGLDKAFETAKENDRLDFNSYSPDIRNRNTWWSNVIGGTFMWLVNLTNQSTIQRVSSVKTVGSAQRAYIFNILLTIVYGMLLLCVGFVVFAYFKSTGCDPFDGGFITNRNQVVPYFVIQTMQDIPGMSGFFMATLFSGSLSTMSSGINALAANTVEDFLKIPLSTVSERCATRITKLFVCFYGVVIVGLAYGANAVKGPLTQMALSVFGACGGPILGIFLAGASIPWVNKHGALSGLIFAIGLTMWISVGNQLYGRKVELLKSPSIENCYSNVSSLESFFDQTPGNFSHKISPAFVVRNDTFSTEYPPNVQEPQNSDPYAFGFFPYDISYEWYALIGTLVSFLGSILFSLPCRNVTSIYSVKPKLVFPVSRRYWCLRESSNIKMLEMEIDNMHKIGPK